jgi:hypothetical protein
MAIFVPVRIAQHHDVVLRQLRQGRSEQWDQRIHDNEYQDDTCQEGEYANEPGMMVPNAVQTGTQRKPEGEATK